MKKMIFVFLIVFGSCWFKHLHRQLQDVILSGPDIFINHLSAAHHPQQKLKNTAGNL